MRIYYFTLGCLLLFATLFAQEEQVEVMGVNVNGYVDGYWQTKLTDNENAVADRSFYTDAQSFAVGNINVTLSKEMGDFGAVGQFGFGPRAEAANDADYPNIQQLYIYWNASDKVKLTFGEFGTFVGYEVIDAPANFHYSTSNLFQNGPFFHTGVKADFDLGDGFGAMVGVFNQTDEINDINGDFTNVGTQLSYSSENSNIYLNFIYGGAGDQTAKINRGQADIVADTSLGDVYLALNASYQFNKPDLDGAESVAWWGVAGYGQYTFNETVAGGIRLEYMDDSDNVIGAWGNEGNVFSTTLSFPLSKSNFKFIPEIRYDMADDKVYNKGEDDTQLTLGAALMYSF